MRKVWDLAFSGKALGEYGVRLGEHVERLVGTIKERVDAKKGTAERETTRMCAGFSFDIMADLVYGVGNYGMQDETGDFEYMVSSFVLRELLRLRWYRKRRKRKVLTTRSRISCISS